jgi:hypothetical protein
MSHHMVSFLGNVKEVFRENFSDSPEGGVCIAALNV